MTAQAYDGNNNPVTATFKWYSSNPDLVSVSSTGLVTRVNQLGSNSQAVSYDSNGGVSQGQIGGISTIRAVALRGDGSESGVEGSLVVTCQGSAPRQYADNPFTASTPSVASGSYNLVQTIQPPVAQS